MQAIIISIIMGSGETLCNGTKDQNKDIDHQCISTQQGNELFICIHQKNQQHYDYIAERQIC